MGLLINEDRLQKAFGLPESVDPTHKYVYRTGEHGIYDFWYVDNFGNYWLYTNAPDDHPDYEPFAGAALIDPDQPMQHTAPQFFAEDGRKLNAAVPEGVDLLRNEAYDPLNPRSVWYAIYENAEGLQRFVYYDSDVRENLDLWVQHQLRVVDAGLVRYRKYAAKLFESPHPKDRIFAVILMLIDQGMFEAYELTTATVGDVEYTDMTISFLGKKLVCDPLLVDFFTSITAGRNPDEPLFVLDTNMGRRPIGVRHIYSVLKGLRMSPHFMLYWHASQIFSRIVHRLAMEGIGPEDFEERAFSELSRAFCTPEDISHLVDYQLRTILRQNFRSLEEAAPEEPAPEGDTPPPEEAAPEAQETKKALAKVTQDDFGVLTIWSDLAAKRPDELQFSVWLQATPLHDVSEEELVAISEQIAEDEEQQDQPEPSAEAEEGAVREADDEEQASEGAKEPKQPQEANQ